MERFVPIDPLKIVPLNRRSLTLAALGFGMTWWGVTPQQSSEDLQTNAVMLDFAKQLCYDALCTRRMVLIKT